MEKVGILYICTGKYKVLWPEFYESAEKFFLPECEKHYYVFTDAEEVAYEHDNDKIHRMYQEPMGWPFATLFRFETFLLREEELKQMDYLFFFNADALFLKTITGDMFLPRADQKEDIVVVRHSGYHLTKPYDFTYDRNPFCKAFIPYGKGEIYVTGSVNGGTSEGYLRMCRILAARTREDLSKNIIALWHDESHLNKYILEYDHYRLLTPSYSYPSQEWWPVPVPYEPRITLRDKTKYFDVKKFKAETPKIRRNIVELVYDKTARCIITVLKFIKVLE